MTEVNRQSRVDREEQVSVRQHGGYQKARQVVENVDAGRRTAISRIAQLVWLLFGALEALIGLRVLLKLMAANPQNPLASFIYSFSDLFLWPFKGLTVEPSAQGMVLEIPSIIAMFVFALIGWAIVRLIWLLFYQPASRSVRTVEKEDFDHPVE
jgi:hypothetical protein